MNYRDKVTITHIIVRGRIQGVVVKHCAVHIHSLPHEMFLPPHKVYQTS